MPVVSARVHVLEGDEVMIGGFTIVGDPIPPGVAVPAVVNTIFIRARGPSLAGAGVANVMADPMLEVHSSSRGVIGSNDNWQDPCAGYPWCVGPPAPPYPSEAQLTLYALSGEVTAIVKGSGGGTGVAILEIYEAIPQPFTRLMAMSARGKVGQGDAVIIGGFVLRGDSPQKVVVRGRGPSLASAGVANVLADPMLHLVRASDNAVIASNDDWTSAPNAAELSASGYAPADANDSAILVTLEPGAYTAIVSGARGSLGVGIVEVFAIR